MSRIRSQIAYYDLTGGLNNVSTPDTLNSSPKKTESPDMVNVEFLKLGGIKSMDGNMLVGDKQDSPIVGGWEYTKGNNKYMIIALQDGTVKRLDPVTEEFVELYQFEHPSNRVSFCNMNNGFVATNGIDDPMFYEYGRHQQLSGEVTIVAESNEVNGTQTKFTTQLHKGDRVVFSGIDRVYIVDEITNDTKLTLTEDIETSASDVSIYLSEISPCNAIYTDTSQDPDDVRVIRGSAIQFYAGRLWIGGKNGLFYSGIGEYNGWDKHLNGAGFILEVYNDSSDIKALGLYSDFMMVHKEYNTYLLTMNGDDTSTLSIKPYSNISCDSQQSWIVSNTKYYVYSRENMDIFPLSQRTIFSDRYLGDAITNKVRNVFADLRDSDLENVFCVTLPRKRWMIFYMPMIDRLGSSYGLVFDFQSKAFIVRKVPQEVTIAFNFMNEVYIGTQNGLVLREFLGNSFVMDAAQNAERKYVASSIQPIISYYKSPWFDWAGDYFHSFSEFAIDMSSEYKNDFYIRTFKDGDSPYEDRIITDEMLASQGLMWDGGIEDTPYKYIFKAFPEEVEGETIYNLISEIPNINPDATEDMEYEIDEDVYITSKKENNDLVVYKVNPATFEETEVTTISDYFSDGRASYLRGHDDNNLTQWDKDVWSSGSFTSIRMLLPNNVFETFQLEIGTSELGQAFAIYGYNFRRLETEEAPW